MQVSFYKPSITDEEIDEVIDTLKSGWLTTGPKVRRFEEQFAGYVGQQHAVALNSCTAALHLALEAIGIHDGDVVVVPAMTFAATAEVVRYFNARPLLVDCRTTDSNMDCQDAQHRMERAIASGEKVRAVIPVHYGGQVGDAPGIRQLAETFKLKVIEDAAHCCPAHFREDQSAPWQRVGNLGEISCYSFYANKTITTGEGGMACTNNPEYAERMRIMSLHGISKDAWKRFTAEGSWYYEIVAPGFKYNMTDIAASIGIHQLRRADELHRRRTAVANLYSSVLTSVDELILPRQLPNRIHSWHLFVIRLKLDKLSIDRAQFITQLKQRGVTASVHWMPLHMHPYYRDTYGYKPDDLPVAAQLYREIISLPIYPDMTEAEVEYVCSAMRDVIAKHLRH